MQHYIMQEYESKVLQTDSWASQEAENDMFLLLSTLL